MLDQFGRNIDYLRVSVTDRCNLRCRYCMPEPIDVMQHTDILRYEEILRICRAAVELGITKFKITGGEPLVRAACTEFISALKKERGVEQVTLTTNGLLLRENLPALVSAGLDGGKLLTVNKTKALFADPGNIPAAILTGCKNIAAAEKRGEHEVYVSDWGVTLTTAQAVGDNIKAIGIRAHYFNPAAPVNRCAVEYCDEMEEPFEWIIEFRFKSAAPNAPSVWWRLGKDKRPQTFPPELGVAPANILLLY